MITEISALSDVGVKYVTSDIIATRGEYLLLSRTRSSGRDQRPDAFQTVDLDILEVDAEERVTARIVFDVNDIDAATAELDARYLAGEAADHAHTWSLIADAFAAINRHELPELSSDWVNVDHRRGAAFAAGEMTAYIHDLFDDVPDIHVYVEVVHRLGNLGAVVTQAGHGTSQEGFQAEWREIGIFVFDGDLLSRYELFDESDLDAALARFDELQPRAPRLENAASQVEQRFLAYFATRDWDAYAEILSDDVCIDDHRHVVNAGVRHGRDAEIANVRALADIGIRSATSTVIAVRGGRLFLGRHCVWGGWSDSEASEILCVLEIDAENQIVARVLFDSDDLDAAFAELDARYLAGEAADFAHPWSVIAEGYAAFNRHELPAEHLVTVDRRRATPFESSTMSETLSDIWDLTPDLIIRIEAVHRLGGFGAVVTHVQRGTSTEGFDAEWRMIQLLIVEADRIAGCEIFDEADLDAALARFDELQPRAPRLENAASQVGQRFMTYFATRDWDAYAEILSDDVWIEDRRQAVNAGIRQGRDAEIASMRAIADVGVTRFTSTVIAIRGERLALCSYSVFDGWGGSTVLSVAEINAENQIAAGVAFDPEDLEAAFAELDARYLAGEAAPHAPTWTAIAKVQATYNRHEVPATTADCVNIDHRSGIAFAPGDVTAYIGATYDVAPNVKGHLEAVHRLGNLGVVVTEIVAGTSQEGFAFEWREVALFAFEGDMVSRFELFDETDLDAALARFDELQPQAPRLENAASQVGERQLAHFAARDWSAMTELLAEDTSTDDRRRVVNAGNQHGRDADVATMRALADLGVAHIASTVIATRGERLALTLSRMSGRDQRPDAFYTEALSILEIDGDNRGAAKVVFDPDDIEAAIKELDARYLAGEAADYANTWSVIVETYAAFNRHELPPTTPDWVNIDHRRGIAFAPGDATAYIRASQDPHGSIYVETVHRLSKLGAVFTWVGHGTSQGGFEAEWRGINVATVEGDRINRGEIFDEADLDAALARFDELGRPPSP